MFGENSHKTCNLTQRYLQTPTEPIIGDITFFQLNLRVSAACNGFAFVLVSGLMWYHATHLSKPKEQLDIMRIAILIPCYALLTMGAVYQANAWPFVKPWIEVAQGYALANFWILICRFLAPEDYANERDLFFAPLVALSRKKRKNPLTLKRYRRHWVYIMQGPIVTVLVAIATNIMEVLAYYCRLKAERYIRIALSCTTIASMAMSMVTAIRHCGTLRNTLWCHRAMFKMLSFKLILGLYIILEVIYMFLDAVQPSPLTPTRLLNEWDIEVGVPLMATSCELVLFAVFFCWAYSVSPYKLPKGGGGVGGQGEKTDVVKDADYVNIDGVGDEEVAASKVDSDGSARDGEGFEPMKKRQYQGGRFGLLAWWKLLNHKDMFKAFIFPFVYMEEAAEGGYTGQEPKPKQEWKMWRWSGKGKNERQGNNTVVQEEDGVEIPMQDVPRTTPIIGSNHSGTA